MDIEIREIVSEAELSNSVNVIRESFITVANQFKLTRENAPSNAAFIELEDLLKMKEKDIHLFGVFKDEIQIGFFTVERNDNDLCYLNKLAVLPGYRHNGYGKKMLDFVFLYIKRAGGGKISIGIINENLVLKNWYIQSGFTETVIKNYPHLPFEVCLMEKNV
ncbi:MAG: GNAT family N-acetyltransferase [Syntrophomonadaceae bacterium]|nr:GNAT family N-acetyltransferase [Syntrophomonadaceae bacterium]MDD3271493.1 GNAT family N-acetyltransferase [Syntrophomonadaceae bacterium]MDD3898809.1 GNAT family N-acetyltransferase [Syntrophomonadaceae bacterium]MDD4562731.1 GNAT family N-acetyltransferase [Syntrophomonadaceae bacterium]